MTVPPDPQSIRLVSLDLDGTLIRSDKRLSKHAVRAIQACLERGVRVVLASARPPKSVKQIHQILGLDTVSIHYNGALVYDWAAKQFVKECTLEKDIVLALVAEARKVSPQCLVRVDLYDRWVSDREGLKGGGAVDGAPVPDAVGPLEEVVDGHATRLAIVAQPDVLARIHGALSRRYGDEFERAHSNARVLQLTHPDADKLNAIMWVAKQYGVEREGVMAVGDAANDHGMIEWAGLGVAMGNADAETREIADVVTATNDDDGVAVAIRRYVLGEEA